MTNSFERLMNLAKKTGDRIILYDASSDKSMVVMNLDDYEYLMLGRSNIHKLTEGQLLDQINRDIAVWRSSHGENRFWENESSSYLEDEDDYDFERGDPSGVFDPYKPISEDWHRASDVIGDYYPKDSFSEDSFEEDNLDEGDYMMEGLEDNFESGFVADNTPLDIDWEDDDLLLEEDEIKVEDIPFEPPFVDFNGNISEREVPFSPVDSIGGWEDEPLPSEESVFYEEPVWSK